MCSVARLVASTSAFGYPHVLTLFSARLRCDRQRPCSSCTQRELGPSCSYALDRTSTNDAARQPRVTTQDQIRHLESLVVDLMQQTSANHSSTLPGATPVPPSPTHASDSSPLAASNEELPRATTPPADYGSMQLRGGDASYVSSAHWAAVLDGIAELKDHFDNEEAMHPDPQAGDAPCPDTTGPQLLYGCPKLATKEEILASVPARSVVDRLVSRYFNSFEMSPGKSATP
jgi:hypothetical protein